MYSGRRLWVGDDQADVGGGWMDGQMGSGGVDRSWSQYFLTMPSPTQHFLKDKRMKGYSLEKL